MKNLDHPEIEPLIFSKSHCHPPNLSEVEVRLVENSMKTVSLEIGIPPCRIVQCVMGRGTEKVAAALNSAANLCQTVKRKWKAKFAQPLAPSTVVDLIAVLFL